MLGGLVAVFVTVGMGMLIRGVLFVAGAETHQEEAAARAAREFPTSKAA